MALLDEQYVTVARAADLLKVSKSTLWRWIGSGDLPAYRFGQRRVLLRREDLEKLITPARGEKGEARLQKQKERLSRPLTEAEKNKALAAVEAARRLQQEMLAERGGRRFSDSAQLLDQSRDERTRQLS